MSIAEQQCIDLLFSQSPLYLTREQFEQSLDGWTFDIVQRPDGSIGMVFVHKGPEFHFAKFGNDVQATREHLKKYPGALIEQYGYATTRTPKTATRQQRFNERIGFYKTGADEYDIHYRIDHLRKR
ncbi:MAG: hypothetical protein DDT21_02616 [Syntrophomonadaceae bacterium]|nr:hypothetical protein [Bacillota bacterium]